MENRVVSITNDVDNNSWYHVSAINNPTDITTRISKMNYFEKCFDEPQLLCI